jgi:hypothetical protein
MVPMTSPNDPVFWLHHCFIDKLWADWQAKWQEEPPYAPSQGPAPGHKSGDLMPGLGPIPRTIVKCEDVICHRPFNQYVPGLGYRYDTENKLFHDEELYPFQWISSPNGEYALTYHEAAGRLLLTQSPSQRVIWHSGAKVQSAKCIMESLGNLVIYDKAGGKMWESGTHGNPGGVLEVLDDGHVRIYNQHIPEQGALWQRPPPLVG